MFGIESKLQTCLPQKLHVEVIWNFHSGSIQQDLLIVVLKVLGCIFGQTFKLSNNEEGFFLEMNAWLVYLFVNKVDLVAFTITFHREQTENFDFNPLFPTWTNKKVKKSAAT